MRGSPTDLAPAGEMLAGTGFKTGVRLMPTRFGSGKTLAQLDVRGLTGATVVAPRRGESGTVTPTGQVELKEGDVLALIGTDEAVENARPLVGAEMASLPPEQRHS